MSILLLNLIFLIIFIPKSNSSNLPIILFNNDENGIHMEFLHQNITTINAENAPKVYTTDYKVESLDYNFEEKYMIWFSNEYPYPMFCADFRLKSITDKKLRIQAFKLSILSSKNAQTSGLAVDWIHNLVYYFKPASLSVINVFTPEISYSLTHSVFYNKGGIVVNPIDSFIVWTEYTTIPHVSEIGYSAIIRKSNEDGSNQQILVYQNIRIPICIAIDFESQLILWIDNELHSLSSIDYNGNNRQTIWQSKDIFEDCSSMDVFGDYVYWSSPKKNKIMRISKSGEKSEEVVVVSDDDIDFVKIVHSKRQKNSTNYCSEANCTHLCLPSGQTQYRCLCSELKYRNLFIEDKECNEEPIVFEAPEVPKFESNVSAISELVSSNEPLLLFTARNRDIRIVKLPDNKSIYYMDANIIYQTNYYGLAIDYNLVSNYLIWTKSTSVIYYFNTTLLTFPLNPSQNTTLPLNPSQNTTLQIEGPNSITNITSSTMIKYLAIDWIHNLAYFPSCNPYSSKGILVVNLTEPKALFQIIPQLTFNCNIKDIKVDPIESIIVWSEFNELSYYNSYSYRTSSRYSNSAKIKISSQDGSDIKLLVDSNIVQPKTLTLDLKEKKIYWIDCLLYTLSSINYNGSDLKLILTSQSLFEYSFSMDLYEDYIYWSSSFHDSILKTHKNGFNATKLITVLQAGSDIDGIKVVHNSRQPKANNKCVAHNCSHICLPSNGNNTYKCFCPKEFVWNGNDCQKVNLTTESPITRKQTNSIDILETGPKLLYIVYKEGIFLKQKLEDLETNYIESIELYSNVNWLTEIEYNYRGNYMLWLESNVFDGYSLYAAPIDKTKMNSLNITSPKKLINSRLYASKRMAFDWIHNLVYINVQKGIEVIAIENNNYNYDVVSHNETQGDIAVDPIESIIIWSQWQYRNSLSLEVEYSGKIYKANQDGSHQQLLISESVKMPTTLTIDLRMKMIYWIDTSSDQLHSMDYSGNNLSIILISNLLLHDSFSMDVFGDYIYWSNYERNAILKTHKHGLNNTKKITVVYSYTDLEGLKIMDSSRQLNATNKCLHSNCPQLCLPLQNSDYRCLCSKYKFGITYSRCAQNEIRNKSITANIDKLLENVAPLKEQASTQWLIATLIFSVGINLTLVMIFIYRKKKMPISKYILAKFQNDRNEEVTLNETLIADS